MVAHPAASLDAQRKDRHVTTTQDFNGSWTWNNGVGQPINGNNGQNCDVTFTLSLSQPEEESVLRACTAVDTAGFVDHQQPVRLFLDSLAGANVFPDLYWCQWCHQMFVRTGEELASR